MGTSALPVAALSAGLAPHALSSPLLPPFSTSSGSWKRGARAAVPVRVHVPGRAPLQAPGPGEARVRRPVCRARSRVTAWVLREPQRSSGEEAQALAREAPAVALCAGRLRRLRPGGLQRPGLRGCGSCMCVFNYESEPEGKRAISRGVSVCIGHWSGNVFQPLYTLTGGAMAWMPFNHADFQSLY